MSVLFYLFYSNNYDNRYTIIVFFNLFLLLQSAIVVVSFSKTFGREVHCIAIYNFEVRTQPQFYWKHFYTDCSSCFYTNTTENSFSQL